MYTAIHDLFRDSRRYLPQAAGEAEAGSEAQPPADWLGRRVVSAEKSSAIMWTRRSFHDYMNV